MTELLESPRRLARTDHRATFTSGAPELDEWFRRCSWQNQRAGNAVTYVSMLGGRPVGYYALAPASIQRDHVPRDLGRSRPEPIPCILLARLAVDHRAQGRGVGASLLRDAFLRTMNVSRQLGVVCLLIHCQDEQAREFYLHLVEACPSPLDPLQLVIPLTRIADTLE